MPKIGHGKGPGGIGGVDGFKCLRIRRKRGRRRITRKKRLLPSVAIINLVLAMNNGLGTLHVGAK